MRRWDDCGGGAETSQPWRGSLVLYSSRSHGSKGLGIPIEADIDRADVEHCLSNLDDAHSSAYARLNRGFRHSAASSSLFNPQLRQLVARKLPRSSNGY